MPISRERPVLSLDKAARVMFAILDAGPGTDTTALALALDVPPSTLFRHLDALTASGLLVRIKRGEYRPSLALLRRTEKFEQKPLLAEISRPVLDSVAGRLGMTAHLGVLENEMVTYVVKSAQSEGQVFTREGGQLEAYCSGIGKVLLAALTDGEVANYLAGGPFPKLTNRTLTEPKAIGRELRKVRRQGYAIDAGEILEGLHCVAVPVFGHGGETVSAISASSIGPDAAATSQLRLKVLREASVQISQKLGHRL